MDTMFRDELAPLRHGLKKAGIKPHTLKPGSDPVELAVAYADKAGAVAREFVLDGTVDLANERTGPGLKEILKPVAGDIKAFTRWIASYRALDLHKRNINPGISKADAQYVYDQHKTDEWEQVAKGVTDWNRRVMDYLVEAGGMEKAVAKKMAEMNPVYVPFIRAFAQGEVRQSGGVGKGLTTAGKPIKRIKGSGREIQDPFESKIQQTQKIIATAHKADIARSLANLEEQHGGLAGLIWKVPAPKQATQFQAEQIKKDVIRLAVERLGIDPADIATSGALESWDDILTVYTNAGQYYGKDNIVTLVKDGQRQFYEVDPDLYQVLQGMDHYSMPWLLNLVLGAPTRAVRLGATGLSPAFGLIRNFSRDAATFAVQAEHAKLGPISAVGGIIEDIRRTEGAQKFKSMGGKMSGQLLQDRTATQHLRGEMLASSRGRWAFHTVTHPVQALRELFGVTEAGTRIGEFTAALKVGEQRYGKGTKDAAIFALNAAQDVTTNFTRHGRIGKILNQLIAFFNAAIQGPDKMVRSFRARPLATTLKALVGLTLPAIWLWWMNKDEEWYKELPPHEKHNYLHFRIPGTEKIVRIPIPFQLGHIFQAIPVAGLDAAYQKDPQQVKDALGVALEQANPLDWPAAIGPAVQMLANKDFAGRPIVPKRLEGKLPEDQFKTYTPKISRVVGKTIGVSPLKLDHLANSYSGGLYSRVARTGELVTGGKEGPLTLSDIPVLGTLFLRDPYAPKASIRRFYERRELLSRKNQSKKITPLENAERLWHGRRGRKLSPLWKQLWDAETVSDRKAIYAQVRALVQRPAGPWWGPFGRGRTRTSTETRTRTRR